MDELLELMEEDPPSEPKASSSNDGGMDELLTLLDGNEEDATGPLPTPNATHRRTTVVTPSNPSPKRGSESQSSEKPKGSSKPVSAGIDDKLGIRMIERNMSSVDLVDLVSMNPYHSPATLSAMSLAGLSRLLIDPPRVVDQATVCGKMSVVTVGVVFGNTGTRISSKGGAFCVLTIGNFVSGPCVSVMLFGEPYSKYCRTCVPGKVIALANPKLMNIQPGSGKTSVSFSVYDASQILMVAKAMDYGTCKATVKVKDHDGKWTAGGKCKNYIDKRKCDFCDVHRKKQQKKNGHGSLQNLRSQAIGQVALRVPNVLVHQPGKGASANRFLNIGGAGTPRSLQLGRVPMQMQKVTPTASQQRQHEAKSSNRLLDNRALPPRQNENTCNNRLLGAKGTASRSMGDAGPHKKSGTLKKSQQKRKTGIIGSAPLKGDGDWFQKASAPQVSNSRGASFVTAAKKKKQRTINTGRSGFDGSVPVPKESHLFQSKGPLSIPIASSSAMPQQQTVEDRQKIRQNQAALAQLLKQSSNNLSTKKKCAPAKKGGSFYAGIGAVDLEKAKNTKSRFGTEVEAEEYVKSRQKVVDLEKLETSKAKKKQKDGKEHGFATQYVCKSCGITSSRNPTRCVIDGHKVIRSRSLKENQSKAEKRTSLHQKSAEDGGLRLGAGNEWSRNLKDFHS